MAAFCLPQKFLKPFEKALRSGELSPKKLQGMTSQERREAFAKYIGEENARETNLLFERKLLLKDQQKAMVNFINDLQGLNPISKRDMVDQVMGLKDAISPANARKFLEDLVSKRLGAVVSHDEAKLVYDLAKKAEDAKQAWRADPKNEELRINFGVDLVKLNDTVNELKGNNMTAWDHALNAINLPKQISTTADLSATLVQLGSMVTSGRFLEGFIQQFKYFHNEANYDRLRADMITHPYYDMMTRSKLAISEVGDKLRPGEELIQSNLIEQANTWLNKESKGLIPNGVRAANRAFVGYVNYVRFKTFVDLVDAARLRGEDIAAGSKALRDISENINTFTGYGNVGLHDSYGNAVPFLNLFLWTTRKVSSTLTLMSPVPFMKSSPTARRFAMRQLGGYLTATAALYGLASAIGYEVPTDPSDEHFGWVKIGDTWHNPLGDKPTYARLLWRIATGRIVSGSGLESKVGEGFPPITRKDLIERFARGKLSPTASIIADFGLYGSDFMGNKMEWDDPEAWKSQAENRMVPMGMSTFIDVVQNDPDNTVGQILSLTSLFGVNAYVEQPKSRQGLTAWGDSLAGDADEGPDLAEKLLEIGETMNFPPKKINKVELTDKQYHDYILLQGQSAKQQLTAVIESGEWDAASKDEKIQGWRAILSIARRQAVSAIMLNSQDNQDGEENSIFDKMEKQMLDAAPKSAYERNTKSEPSLKKVLNQPVRTEADLEQQWSEMMIRNYDYGRMKEVNPLAYLGYLAVKDKGIASYYKTPLNALGITFKGNPDESAPDYPVIARMLKEAGIDPKSAKGSIVLGPEFAKGQNTYTLEHELMHRGMAELEKSGFKSTVGDHLMIQGHQHLYGNNKHSTELEEDMMGNNLKDEFKNDEKSHKEFAEVFKEDIDKVQEAARKLINKGN